MDFRFIPNSHLAVSASMYQVRVWDLRSNQCVKLLQSSGQVVDGTQYILFTLIYFTFAGDGGPIGSRQNTVPFLETPVNAIEVIFKKM